MELIALYIIVIGLSLLFFRHEKRLSQLEQSTSELQAQLVGLHTKIDLIVTMVTALQKDRSHA